MDERTNTTDTGTNTTIIDTNTNDTATNTTVSVNEPANSRNEMSEQINLVTLLADTMTTGSNTGISEKEMLPPSIGAGDSSTQKYLAEKVERAPVNNFTSNTG